MNYDVDGVKVYCKIYCKQHLSADATICDSVGLMLSAVC